jgi:hypothetical protein
MPAKKLIASDTSTPQVIFPIEADAVAPAPLADPDDEAEAPAPLADPDDEAEAPAPPDPLAEGVTPSENVGEPALCGIDGS